LTKEQVQLLSRDVVKNNKTFLPDQILEMNELFQLYQDYQNKRMDMRDILVTAQTLGLDKKYILVFRLLNEIYEENQAKAKKSNAATDSLDFDTFVELLTEKLVLPLAAFNAILGQHADHRGPLRNLQYHGHQGVGLRDQAGSTPDSERPTLQPY